MECQGCGRKAKYDFAGHGYSCTKCLKAVVNMILSLQGHCSIEFIKDNQ